ncbi:hypothetical protein EGR_11055 [Echinococcus granulosus]|uniref:Uncharacterized protein n=1 Tax=Echinococcus granulosus TaxID=6210 RepID=W6TZD0_ECHGR|nr:hypothetical protein EGR_11055 [Echinococcus granulosus]EUB54083.1 hypothetical protein EGR_11055 [Echinococcus granulosus]
MPLLPQLTHQIDWIEPQATYSEAFFFSLVDIGDQCTMPQFSASSVNSLLNCCGMEMGKNVHVYVDVHAWKWITRGGSRNVPKGRPDIRFKEQLRGRRSRRLVDCCTVGELGGMNGLEESVTYP